MTDIAVNLPQGSYSIVIEQGLLALIGERVRSHAPNARCLLAMDHNVLQPHGEIAIKSLRDAGYEVEIATVIADEKSKTLATVESLYRTMLEARLDRASPVIALGGGIIGDIVGFAAATYLRGVPLIQAPTTLLAMVDAAIGGKSGVNFPLPHHNTTSAQLGKNLIGAFWQPRAVLVDPSALRTLPARDFRCGLAECIKHAMIADAALLRWLHENAHAIEQHDAATLIELIRTSARIKATIVAEDERESGRRALLNLGHTFAHALESISELELRHGEAVAIGLRAASHVAVQTGRMSAHEQHVLLETIARCGLPSRLPSTASVERLMTAMQYDKKTAGGRMRLVLPRGIGSAEIVDQVPLQLVRETWLDLGAGA